MDFSIAIFRILLLLIVAFPNYLFFRNRRDIKKKFYIHQLIFFLISVILPFLIMLPVAILITSPVLINLLDLKIDMNNFTSRAIFASITYPPSFFANIFLIKFYLKRIPKTNNEIELIGKE